MLQEGRKILNQLESRAVLKAFNIPINPSWNTHSANEALVAAESVGFPVVLKINSPDISHKVDFSGVSLNVMNAQAVRSAYKGKDTVNASASLGFIIPITEEWRIVNQLTYTWLGDGISDSPLIKRDNVFSGMIMTTYTF